MSAEFDFLHAYHRWPFELEVTYAAQGRIEMAIRAYIASSAMPEADRAELETIANQIRAHLQHYVAEARAKAAGPTDEELLA